MFIIYKLKVVLIILYYILIRLQIMFQKYLKHKGLSNFSFQSIQKSLNQLFKRTRDFFKLHHSSWNAFQNKQSFYILLQFFLSFFAVSKVLFWIIHHHFLIIFLKHLFFQIRRTFKWTICKVTCFIIFALKF